MKSQSTIAKVVTKRGNQIKFVKFAIALSCAAMLRGLGLAVVLAGSMIHAQTTAAITVPRIVRYAGVARDINGKPLTGVVGVTFALYADQNGGAPLWLETQNVQADPSGHYSVLLGSTKPEGLPAEIFASEQARWMGVQLEQQAEQPRILLVSVPYALKAGDAETLGGLPPSAFVHVAPGATASVAKCQGLCKPTASVAKCQGLCKPTASIAKCQGMCKPTASVGKCQGLCKPPASSDHPPEPQ